MIVPLLVILVIIVLAFVVTGLVVGVLLHLLMAGLIGWLADTLIPGRVPYGFLGVAEYLDEAERYPVLSRNRPGELTAALPRRAPEQGESLAAIFEDFKELIVPAITHWNSPMFFAYFAITGSGPGILGELLAAAL